MASTPQEQPRPPQLRAVPRPTSKEGRRYVRPDGRVEAEVVGVQRRPLGDAYFAMLSASWTRLLLFIAAVYLGINAMFATIYTITGGVQGARDGNFGDAFFFSVQTMATIGYGSMSPKTPFANVLVTAQALIGMLSVAMATGVLFAKFARPTGQLVFSDVAVVNFREGVPSFMFRVANERSNHVAEATMKVHIVMTEVTVEGDRMRRWYELPLVRRESPLFALTWTAIHQIGEGSKLWGMTPDKLRAVSTEIIVTLIGMDSTLAATIHKRHSYVADEIVYGGRLVDVLGQREDGRRYVDLTKLHAFTEHPEDAERVFGAILPPA